MFIVGLFVGRGTAPVRFDIEKMQKELSELRKTAAARKRADKASVDRVKKKTDLEFYEALKKKDAPVKKTTAAIPPKKEPAKKPAVKKTSPPTVKTIKPAEKKSSANVEKPEPAKGNLLTIQVAALKDPTVADQLVERLKKKGYSAYRTVVKIPGKGTWYRIRIGSYRTRADASETLEKLKQEGLDGFFGE